MFKKKLEMKQIESDENWLKKKKKNNAKKSKVKNFLKD